jgi:hypothetical protein
MLLRPSGFKTFTDGQSDDRPIVLQNVKSIDFERILWMFYNGFGFFDPLYARKGADQVETAFIPTTLPLRRNGLLSYR